jgi:hypothetical protein
MSEVRELNAYEVLKHQGLLITRAAFEKLVKDRKGTLPEPKVSAG